MKKGYTQLLQPSLLLAIHQPFLAILDAAACCRALNKFIGDPFGIWDFVFFENEKPMASLALGSLSKCRILYPHPW